VAVCLDAPGLLRFGTDADAAYRLVYGLGCTAVLPRDLDAHPRPGR
jgi:hypothetical protein